MSLGQNSLLKKNYGALWATGTNSSGQLGLGDTTQRTTFTKVNITDVKSISCGYVQTFILKKDGTVWATGNNAYGQLGLGDTTQRTTFTKVNITDVKDIVSGGSHTIILKNDGTVWSTGNNASGQLGLGDNTNRTTFTKVNITDVKSIACGYAHIFIMKNDGTVWTTGYNYYGQLGLGDITNRTTFTKVNITDVKSIACGFYSTCALKNDGTLWATGNNASGQLGLGDTTHRNVFTKANITDVKSIACGDTHTIILKNDGTVWTTGNNAYGQLGLGDTTQRTTFTKVNITDVKSIACGYSHTSILKNYGALWATGTNSSGQLGLGDTTNRNIFTKVDITGVRGLWENPELDIISNTQQYIIKTIQSIYTINTELKILTEISDALTDEIIQRNGVDIEVINENIDILPTEFSLVSDSDFELGINGLKDNTQMIVASNDFVTIIQENIDYFKSESTKTGTSVIKLIFSIDGGSTWKTYKDNVIVDLAIKIPCKEFSTLSEEDLSEWNTAKSEILLNGIDVDVLATIDFNTLWFDKIRFAYAMQVENTTDIARTSRLLWQFDSKGSMQQLKDTEFDLRLHSTGVEFKPLVDADMIKINILPNGVGVSGDIEFATDNEIENMFNQGGVL